MIEGYGDVFYEDIMDRRVREAQEAKKREDWERQLENTPITIETSFEYRDVQLAMGPDEILAEMKKRGNIINRDNLPVDKDTEFIFSMSPQTPFPQVGITNLGHYFPYPFRNDSFSQNQVFFGRVVGGTISDRFDQPVVVAQLNPLDRFRKGTDYAYVWAMYLKARVSPDYLEDRLRHKQMRIDSFIRSGFRFVPGSGYPESIALLDMRKDEEQTTLYTFDTSYPHYIPNNVLPHRKRITTQNRFQAYVDLKTSFDMKQHGYNGWGIPITFPDFRPQHSHSHFLITPEELSKFQLEVID